jgi:ABC-type Mn2+/Zn2+ transport system permease subunit
MNDVLGGLLLVVLFLLPGAVLGIRASRPKWMPWWAAFLTVIGVGWLLILTAAMLRESPESGAGHVMALFFGWAYALVWFLPWLGVYGLIRLVQSRMGRRSA